MAPPRTGLSLRALLFGGICLLACACGARRPTAQPPPQSYEDIMIQRGLIEGQPWAKAQWLARTTPLLEECEQLAERADASVGKALDRAHGGGADGAPSMASLVSTLRDAGSAPSIEAAASDGVPLLELAAKGANVPLPLAKLREDVGAINETNRQSYATMTACIAYAKKLTYGFAGLYNAGTEPSADMFAIYARFLRATSRGQHAVATSVALVAALEGAFGGKDARTIDAIVEGARKARETPIEVTDEQAREAYRIAADKLVQASLSQMDAYCADHPELSDENLDQYFKEHPDKYRPEVNPCSKSASAREKLGLHREEDARPVPSQGDANALADDGATSTPTVTPEVAQDTIRKLVPDDTMAAHAMDALRAVQKGDVKGAIRSALALIPIGGPLFDTIGRVLLAP